MLEDAFAAVEKADGWTYLWQPNVPGHGGFMFSQDKQLTEITKEIDKDGKIGHSGATFGWTMRQMEYIAKQGHPSKEVKLSKKIECLPPNNVRVEEEQ